MAKKKRPRPRGSPAQWPTSDVTALLAWLDHTLKHKEIDFENSVVGHLDQVYTLPQIFRKLLSLWNTHGPEQKLGFPRSTWKSDLFHFGSTCLNATNGLRDEILEEISRKTETLEEEYFSAQLPTPTRRLRSTSRQNDFSLSRYFSQDTPTRTATRKARTPRIRKFRSTSNSLTPSAVKREIDQTESPPVNLSAASKKRRKLPEKPSTISAVKQRKQPSQQPQKEQTSRGSHTQSVAEIEDSDDLSKILSEDLGDSEADKKPIRCICGAIEEWQPPPGLTVEDTSYGWVLCTGCEVWQHQICARNSLDRDTIPVDYFCEKCRPKAHKKTYDRRVSSRSVNEETSVESIEQTSKIGSAESTYHRQELPQATPTTVEISISTIDAKLENARERIKDLEEELFELKQDLNDRDLTVAALEREKSSLYAAQKRRDEQTGLPFEELIERNLILEQRRQATLKIRDEGSTFTQLTATSREWFGTTKVDDGFCDIYGQSRQALCRGENESLPFTPTLVKYGELEKLASKCLGVSRADTNKLQEAMCKLSKHSPEAIIRALITSALSEWVFESDYPQFDGSPSEVLSKYRELLATQDGALIVRNLDLAARAALTKGTVFRQHRIPNTAKDLAIKLSQTLASLFSESPNSAEERDYDGFATWNDDKMEWMDRRKRFTQMFRFALETKADSCLNIQDYEILIYPPGTMFDKRTMEVETSACVKDTSGNHEGRVVQLCLEAAVFAHGRPPLLEDSSAIEAVISSKNFVQKHREDRIGIKPAVKAVVILSEK